jgi:enamine deaminase RidA (YjgF/YER057c/UK114 family)
MENPVFILVPGSGEMLRGNLYFSSAVRVGDRVETSGQGGWNDDPEIPGAIDEEIAPASSSIGT